MPSKKVAITSKSERKLGIVSLYAGAGGLDISACQTGIVDAIVSTDANATFLSTIEKNLPVHFPEVRHSSIVEDGRTIKGATLKKLLGSTPDIVMGGPPCDDFTSLGKKRGLDGEKGNLIYQYLRVVNEIKPKAFIFENVPNLAKQFRKAFEAFLSDAEDMGYYIKWALLKACDYGAPTSRTRIFVVGWKSQINNNQYQFPEVTHRDPNLDQADLLNSNETIPMVYIRDILQSLPDVGTVEAKKFLNHVGRPHRPETIEHLKTVPMGKSVKKSYRYRSPWEGLIQSLTAGVDYATKSYIHPIYHREMSVREYARIHGFPDSWDFEGTHHNGIKQVANAVPVPLGSAVIKSVAQVLTK
jgi:DNA (cytosine-5)-methyltransferase 1